MRIGQIIRAHREKIGATLEQIAAAAGTTASNLSKIESAASSPAISKLARVAEAMGVHLWQLIAQAEGNAQPAASSLDEASAQMLWLFQRASPEGKALLLGGAREMLAQSAHGGKKNATPPRTLKPQKRRRPKRDKPSPARAE